MKRKAWELELERIVREVVPIKETPVKNKNSPLIVNIVSTVRIIEQTSDKKYRLPLQSLSLYLGACSQYAPVQFAANILKVTTSTTDSTALVFGSGSLVQVSALSPMNTIYNSQLFRIIIEQIPCVMTSKDGPKIGTLSGHTIFSNSVTHNIVAHGNLGTRIDLRRLRDANPSACKWFPDLFPALKCSIWLTEDQKCHCRTTKKEEGVDDEEVKELLTKAIKRKCACTIKCLIFDSGRIVITGGRRIEDVNSVFYRVKQLSVNFDSNTEVVPREDRFLKRLATMMVVTGNTTKNVKTRAKGELTQSEAISIVLDEARDFKVKKTKTMNSSLLCPLMKLADAGRFSEVEKCVAMDPEQLNFKDENDCTVIERLQSIERTVAQEKILVFLTTLKLSV